jgi:hypothetical protein
MQQIGPVSAFSLLCQARLDLFDLDADIGKLADAHENAMRDLMMTATNEPARSLRQKKHSRAEDERRCDRQAEHPSPALNAGKSVICQIRKDDADGDRRVERAIQPSRAHAEVRLRTDKPERLLKRGQSPNPEQRG